MQIRRKCKYSL